MDTLFFISIAIFTISYAFIVSEKIHRTVIALSGAIVMIISGVLTQEIALKHIDFNTIGLLIGMMILVGIAKDSGMFEFAAIWTCKKVKGRPFPIFFAISFLVAIFSAFLDNVTTVLLMTPVIFVIANNLKINPTPMLVGAILLSNTGGLATLIGDPPNILIGSATDLTFNDFLINLGPISLITSFSTALIVVFWYRKKLVCSQATRENIMRFNPRDALTNKSLLIKSLISIGVVLIGFMTHEITGLDGATIALGGATLLFLLTLNDPEKHLHNVEWTSIFFFVGLFILVGGLVEVGAIGNLAKKLVSITAGNLHFTAMILMWGSAIISGVVDNIPLVATMIPLIKDVVAITGMPSEPLWWALAIGADIGGNATLLGASANVVVASIAEKEGNRISFFAFLKIGLVTSFVSMVLATGYYLLKII